MFRIAATTLAITLASTSTVMAEAEIDTPLQDAMRAAAPGESVRALLYLHDQLDVGALEAQFNSERATRAHRHFIVVETLQSSAAATQ